MSDKNQDMYSRVLRKHNIDPQRFVMVGNSLRSDILPIVALGGKAVYIPYHTTGHTNSLQMPLRPTMATLSWRTSACFRRHSPTSS